MRKRPGLLALVRRALAQPETRQALKLAPDVGKAAVRTVREFPGKLREVREERDER